MWRWIHLAATVILAITIVVLMVRPPTAPSAPPASSPADKQDKQQITLNTSTKMRLEGLGYQSALVLEVRGGLLDGWVSDLSQDPPIERPLDAEGILQDVRALKGKEDLPLSAIDSTLIVLLEPKAKGAKSSSPGIVYLEVRTGGKYLLGKKLSTVLPTGVFELSPGEKSTGQAIDLGTGKNERKRIAEVELFRE